MLVSSVCQLSFLPFICLLFIVNKKVCARPLLESEFAIQSEIIDPANRTIWAMFNLTDAQLNRVKMQINSESKGNTVQRDINFDNIREFRINDIKQRLESALKVGNSEESQDQPTHEMAAYPICSSDSNDSSWLHDNNITIRFSNSVFELKDENLNLDSAILRLYKVNPIGNLTNSEEDTIKRKICAEPLLESQIRITVSIVQQVRRNKRKKRIFNTMMMDISKTGWVEIDIKRAIYFWESEERQQPSQQLRQSILVGWLMIEVHDEEDRPLKPGLFFQPPKCDQADFAIPWNYYGPQTAMSSFKANKVPRYPRLDVKLIGYASFAPKTINNRLHEKLRQNLQRQILESANNISEFKISSISSESKDEQYIHNHHKRHSSSQLQRKGRHISENGKLLFLKDEIGSVEKLNLLPTTHIGHKRGHHHSRLFRHNRTRK